MRSLQEFIVNEGLKDKIKKLINKFKNEKVPEKVWSEDDVQEYKDKEITENDADTIIEIICKIKDQYGDPYFSANSNRSENLYKLAYKQGLLDFAYFNYKDILNQDPFGEAGFNNAYYKACKDNNVDSYSISAGYYCVTMAKKYFQGWSLSQKLNLKCAEEIKLNFKGE